MLRTNRSDSIIYLNNIFTAPSSTRTTLCLDCRARDFVFMLAMDLRSTHRDFVSIRGKSDGKTDPTDWPLELCVSLQNTHRRDNHLGVFFFFFHNYY